MVHAPSLRSARTVSILGTAVLAALSIQSAALAQIRIANYNIDADTNGTAVNPGTSTVLQGISQEKFNNILEPLDILTLEETTSNSELTPLVSSLNTLGNGTYKISTLQASSNSPTTAGNGPSALIYNSSKVQLIDSAAFGALSTSGPARQIVRYHFQPLAYAPALDSHGNPVAGTADFYVYVDHAKADSGLTNEMRRNVEAQQLRADAALLPAGSRIIYTGDYNLTAGNAELSWATMLGGPSSATDPGHAIDPVYGTGAWTNSNSPLYIPNMSEATGYDDNTKKLGTGSLSARFDVELGTTATMDGHGFSLINGSYHVYGNTSVTWHGQVVASGNPQPNGAGMADIKAALSTSSDHYPVVADYRLPASMGVSASVADRVIVGATNVGTVTVANNAPVAAAIDADTLSYSVITTGTFSGNGNGTDLAALSSNMHTLALANTATPGVVHGVVNLSVAGDSVNQEVQNVPSPLAIQTTVVSHAHPSLAATAGVASVTIDLGMRAFNSAALGLGTPSANFAVNNVADASGFTAALDLDSITGSGGTSHFSTNAATFSNLVASGSQSFNASLLTNNYGSFSASYTLNLSDENIPGATATAPLVVNVVGRIAMAGDANDDGFVNALDFNALATHYSQSGQSWSAGDFNGDGSVNSTDFDALAANFGSTYVPNPADLPEDSLAANSVLIPEPILTSVLPAILLLAGSYRTRRVFRLLPNV